MKTLRSDLHGTIFVACDNGLRQAHDMIYDCCVRQKKCRSILKHVLKRYDNRKSCRRPVANLSHATKIVPCKLALRDAHLKYHAELKDEFDIDESKEYYDSEEAKVSHFLDNISAWIRNDNRTKWSPIRSVIIRVINKIGRPICLITGMKLQTELDDTKSCYQLLITITISEKTNSFSLSNVTNSSILVNPQFGRVGGCCYGSSVVINSVIGRLR